MATANKCRTTAAEREPDGYLDLMTGRVYTPAQYERMTSGKRVSCREAKVAYGHPYVPEFKVKTSCYRIDQGIVFRSTFSKPVSEETLAELVQADEDGGLFEMVDCELSDCEDAAMQAAKHAAYVCGVVHNDPCWHYDHEYGFDEERKLLVLTTEVCMEDR